MNFLCVMHHDVTDWARFDGFGADVPHAPEGAECLAYFPSRDHRAAMCVWRARDPGALRTWLDAKTQGLSRNTWMEVDERHAMGLTKLAAVLV